MKVTALINFKDFVLNKDIKEKDNLIEKYKEANIELTKERIDVLVAGNKSSNFKPFVEVVLDKKEKKDDQEPTLEEIKKGAEEQAKMLLDKEPVIETADLKIDNIETAIKNKGKKEKKD